MLFLNALFGEMGRNAYFCEMRKLRSILTITASAWSLPGLCAAHVAEEQNTGNASGRPNVIIIYADDLGIGDLGCYGGQAPTPHVDALARQGIRFTNMHAMAATSTPSRYALLTGQYAWRQKGTDVAAGNAGMIIRPEQYTMADMFRNAGYQTAAIGKWHLGLGDQTGQQDWNAPLPCGLQDLGFTYHYIMAATADRVPCVFIEDGMVANWDSLAPIEVNYRQNFPGEPTGRTHPQLLTKLKPSHGHDMSIVNGISRIGYMKGGGRALWRDEDIADSIASHANRFIRQNASRPFFMYLCTNDVHVPRYPHERFRGKSPMGLRGEAILQFDWTVGQVLHTLDELGLRENTLIILSSDNGAVVDDGYADRARELLGNHNPMGPYRGGKYSAFEAGTMVPAIVSWPGHVPGGKQSDALQSQIDWFASLSELVGARLPKGAAPDSRSFLATLLGKSSEHRPWVVGYSAQHIISLRTPEWKYIPASSGEAVISWGPAIETGAAPQPQLYNMQKPFESKNLAPKHPEIVVQMQAVLDSIDTKIVR